MTDRDGLQDSAYGWVEKHDSVKRKRADGKKWMIGISMNKENGRKVGVTKEMG